MSDLLKLFVTFRMKESGQKDKTESAKNRNHVSVYGYKHVHTHANPCLSICVYTSIKCVYMYM